MTSKAKLTVAGILAAGAMIFATGASARVVCIGDDCWHPKEVYDYPADAGVVVHEDNWAAGPSVRWREHSGRGYWHGERWTDF